VNSVDLLLTLLDQAYDHRAWHGTNLKGSLRRLSAAEATWRPAKGRHNIWEIAVHCAYWKYTVRRRILGEKRGSFPLTGSNWFYRHGVEGDAVWKADLALLHETHRSLRAAVASLTPRDLRKRSATGTWTLLQMIEGAASHDLYHAGQIQLLKRLRPTTRR
jgi:uncharacterized damage-inducible protein DinB